MLEIIQQYLNSLISKGLSQNTIKSYKKDLLQLSEHLSKYFENGNVDIDGNESFGMDDVEIMFLSTFPAGVCLDYDETTGNWSPTGACS